MELRKLQASDLFAMVKILNGVGLNNIKDAINFDELSAIREKRTDENSAQLEREFGMNVIMSVVTVIFERMPVVENDLYNFVGSVANMKAKDVAKMDIVEFMDLIIAIVHKEEFADFFIRASKLIKLA